MTTPILIQEDVDALASLVIYLRDLDRVLVPRFVATGGEVSQERLDRHRVAIAALLFAMADELDVTSYLEGAKPPDNIEAARELARALLDRARAKTTAD
jgi:hypothetical protein